MGLGRIDKLHSFTRACTKPTQGGYCIVGALLVLGRATGNTDTQDSSRLGLGGSHHLTPYSILCVCPQDLHPNGLFVPKSPKLRLPWLWSPITLRTDLQLRCSLKQSCSSHRELCNSMSHALCWHTRSIPDF